MGGAGLQVPDLTPWPLPTGDVGPQEPEEEAVMTQSSEPGAGFRDAAERLGPWLGPGCGVTGSIPLLTV